MKRRRLIAFASVILAACTDGGRSSGPSFAISDAVTGDITLNPHFFWLPPLVPSPTVTGDFNPFATPVVTVCQLTLTGTACATDPDGNPIIVAQFTMTSGTGSEVIRVSTAEQLYIVNWHTDLSNLDPDSVYRVTVSLDGEDMGFADVEVGLTGKELKSVSRDEFVPLVDGRTLPLKFRIDAGAGCVGVAGGCVEAIVDPNIRETLVVLEGNVPLAFGEFPVGWTDEPQLVRIERIPDAGFGPGEGPLGTDFPQYPLFFEYVTSAPDSFNLPVRIGVCNVGEPEESEYHPHHRPSTVLAMGGTPAEFRTLPRARSDDVLGDCSDAQRMPPEIGGIRGRIDDLAARVGRFAGALLAPRPLYATSSVVLDGGMGGETESFTPAGTVDTASGSADLIVESLTHLPVEPTDADLIEFTAVVKNVGTAAAGRFSVLVLSHEDNDGTPGRGIDATTLSSGPEGTLLEPGQTISLRRQRTLQLPVGDFVLLGTADIDNEVAESNEGNNTAMDRFGVSAGVIDFETFTGGAPACASCALTDQFATRGVVFSFTPLVLEGECATPTNAQLFLSSGVYDPAGGPDNHSATAAGNPGAGGGFCSGTVNMAFAGLPTTVTFQLRGNSVIAIYPVTAFDASGNPILATQIARSNVTTYTPAAGGFVGRQETVTVSNAAGIARIELAMNGFIALIDNLFRTAP